MGPDLITQIAQIWHDEKFAIAWTGTNEGPDAKAVKSKGWNETKPFAQDVDFIRGLLAGRIGKKNPALIGRASGLILIDCDSTADVELFKSFGPPLTRSVLSRMGRHYVYRVPAGWDEKYAGIYFEGGTITPKRDCYLITPPAIHPTGHRYAWVNEDVPIAELPMDVYLSMVAAAGKMDSEEGDRMEADPEAKIPPGRRHRELMKMLGNLRRVGLSYDACLRDALELNASRFDPPKTEAEIKKVVDDAFDRFKPDPEVVTGGPTGFTMDGVVSLADVELQSIMFADRPILQWSAFHLLTGKGGSGKGTWLALHAAIVSRGEYEGQPDGKRRTIFISSEDNLGIDMGPRLKAAGVDPAHVDAIKRPFNLTNPDDIAWLRWLVEQKGDVASVVIDPVANHLAGADTNSEAELRDSLAFLNDFSADYNLMMIGVRHLKKDTTGGALASILGSTAWVDLPRAVIVMARDPEDEMLFHMELVKGNRGPVASSGRTYRIELVDVIGSDGRPLKEPITKANPDDAPFRSTDELLGPRNKSSACRFALLRVLSLDNQDADEVKTQVSEEVGASESTVWRAFKKLAGEGTVGSSKDEFQGKWSWFLRGPDNEALVADWEDSA